MNGMDMFDYAPALDFSKPKTASVQLDEDPQSWARTVLTELYRTVPETSDYTPEVMFLKTDEEQGFALGIIVITNATDSALSASRSGGGSSQKALVPVVVKNHRLMPLDLLMTRTGKMYPLNAKRLREALFRPETFEMLTEDWGDTTLYNMFYPPGRSDNEFGAGMSQGSGGGTAGAVTFVQGPGMKMSSENYEMLQSVLPTLRRQDLDDLAEKLSSIPGLMKAAAVNPAMLGALRLLSSAEHSSMKSAAELVDLALESAPVHVVQLGWDPVENQYWVKTASRSAFMSGHEKFMSRHDFLKFAGEEITKKVDVEGTVTLASGENGSNPDMSTWGVVDKPGIYKVKTTSGKEMTGWVIPTLLDLDGTKAPMAVFTNGAAAMVQDQVVGAHVAAGVDLPSGPVKGSGVFYVVGQGGIEATMPLVVSGSEAGTDGGNSYLVTSLTGEKGRIRIVDGVKGMKAMAGDIFVGPSVKFLPMNDEAMTPLVNRMDGLGKTAAEILEPSIVVHSSGDLFHLRFENLPKLASVTRRDLDLDDAVFVLCAAGLDAKSAHDKLAQSAELAVKISGVKDVRLASELLTETRKLASTRSERVVALRRDLVKEAATLPNSMTVDAVLSLGFINSENVRMYTSRLPYLEQCLSMICELLLASRVGLTEIPEFAAARGVRAVDDVIQGLRALSLRDPDAEPAADQ